MISLTAKTSYSDDEHDYTQVRVRSSRCTYYVDITEQTISVRGPGIKTSLSRWSIGTPLRIENSEALAITIVALIEVGEL